MRWQKLALLLLLPVVSGCHALFGGVRLTELATASGKPSNVAMLVTVEKKGQPVADLGPAAFQLTENDQLLDAQAVDLRLLDPSTVATFHTVLVLDLGHANSDERRRQLARAAAAFVRRARQKQGVTVIAFDGSNRTRTVAEFSVESNGSGPEQLDNLLQIAPIDPSRNLHGAVVAALNVLDARLARSQRPVRLGSLVVFSRGPDVAGRVKSEVFEKSVSRTEHQLVYVDVAGDPESSETSSLASAGRIDAPSADSVPIALEDAAIHVNKLLSRYYLLSYCSPGRAGERELEVTVQVTDADGDIERDSVDTRFSSDGFSAGCSSSTPPRFATRRKARTEHSTTATKPAGAGTGSSDPNGAQQDDVETPAADATETDTRETDTEVPPPKNRGYAP